MSELNGSDVSDNAYEVSSDETGGDSHTFSGEINEVNDAVTPESGMDDDLSRNLDNTYSSYLERGDKLDEKDVSEDSSDADEKTDSLDSELDAKYNEYINEAKDASEQKADNSEKSDNAEKNVEHIQCRNENLEGQRHPETGVPFERRQVEADGKQYDVVVPKFESEYDARLPEDKLKSTDREQFKECNTQLQEEIANNKELREQFDDEQLEQIENGETPDGYTWHHDAETGKMQLVDTETHQKTGHTGGRSIWGGGTENR